ncbi:MAG: nicotinate (nicotinamide) nucleotide adenylyltransferase [Planctomycetota bacterium]|nr:MAG: nicotinate (nicotinamide) nucleotide adenylyltransferase [Planctomycetota bacterium]
MIERKIALFGGTFDPIHLGHTTVAAAAAEHIRAEKIVFIPARRSPLKDTFPEAGDDDRVKMITLAIAENKKFQLNDCELKKAEPGYTIETVRKFQTDFGSETSLYWLVGADTIDELPRWYRIVELIDQCNICAMYRAGCKAPDFTKFTHIWGLQRVQKLQQNVIQTPLIDISSSEIRHRLATGQDVTDMLHSPVADYIREHGLYHSKPKN